MGVQVQVKKTLETEPKMLREAMCNGLIALAEQNENIVAMDADLVSSSGMKPFAKRFPDRFINCGIAEANMIGVAAGLAAMGKIPFVHTFGTFASRHVCDQVFMSACYAGLGVRIIGSDPGVCAAYNGGTHMPFEDMAVLRALPEIVLVEVCDSVQLGALLPQIAAKNATYYIRLQRKNPVSVFEEVSAFEVGKGALLRDGKDVTLVCSGIMVAEALKAAVLLEDKGLSARVVNLHTWKPIDTQMLVASASQTGAVVTCENHNIVGGLGSAVAETLCRHHAVPVEMVGIYDEFGEVGPEDYLRERFRLNAADIVAAAEKAVSRK